VTISLLEFMREIDQAPSPAAGAVVRYEDPCAMLITSLITQRKP
jgi:hypothetical protein